VFVSSQQKLRVKKSNVHAITEAWEDDQRHSVFVSSQQEMRVEKSDVHAITEAWEDDQR